LKESRQKAIGDAQDKLTKPIIIGAIALGLGFGGMKALEINATNNYTAKMNSESMQSRFDQVTRMENSGAIKPKTANLLREYLRSNIPLMGSGELNGDRALDSNSFIQNIENNNFEAPDEAGQFLKWKAEKDAQKIIKMLESKNPNNSQANYKIGILKEYVKKYQKDPTKLAEIRTREGREKIYSAEVTE
jgi:hypothetical protein